MDYLTNDTELTAVADAIREKSETTDLLEWPDGFIQAIEDCQTGGPELEWLWGNQITNTMSGTIDSTDDAYAGPILNLGVDGVSTQVTYSGKNLFDKSTAVVSNYINSAGNAAAASGNTRTDFIRISGGETYAFSYGAALASGNYIAWYTDADQSTVTGSRTDARGLTSVTVTSPSDANYVRFSFQNAALNTVQLEAGSTATDYEPYTGGKPSPNPDYPQDILSVDDLSLLMAEKNLLPPNFTTQTVNGVTFTANADGTITANGTASAVAIPSFTFSLPAGTYTVSGCPSGGEWSTYYTYAERAGTPLARDFGAGASFTIDSETTLRYAIRVAANVTVSNKVFYPQVQAGTTTTAYTPYVEPVTVPDLLPEGTELRSLPNGTKDTLHLTYLKPSNREGWAWYDRSVTKLVLNVNLATLSWVKRNLLNDGTGRVFSASSAVDESAVSDFNACLCDHLTMRRSNTAWENLTAGESLFVARIIVVGWPDADATVSEFVSAVSGYEFLYATTNPITTILDPIELPIMPSENATVWCDGGSAQPTFMLEYIQNANIVISRLEDSIADLATS